MFWAAVYQLVKRIPRGRVITYGQLARALKLRGGARNGRLPRGVAAYLGTGWWAPAAASCSASLVPPCSDACSKAKAHGWSRGESILRATDGRRGR